MTGRLGLAGRDDAAYGMAAGQKDAAMIGFAGRSARGIEVGTGTGDQATAAPRTVGQRGVVGSVGMALLASSGHGLRIYLPASGLNVNDLAQYSAFRRTGLRRDLARILHGEFIGANWRTGKL